MDWPVARQIETARLDLEPLAPEHAREMVAVLASPELYAFTGGGPPTEAELLSRYQRQSRGHSAARDAGWLNWILRLRSTRAAVGYVQTTLADEHGSLAADVAWLIAPQEQRAGLATEAATAMLAWLQQHPVTVVRACIHPEHRASARVAEHLGLTPTSDVVDGEVVWVRLLEPAEAPVEG